MKAFFFVCVALVVCVSAKEKWRDPNYVLTEEEMKLGWQATAEKWIREEQAAKYPPLGLKKLRDDEIITLEEGIAAAQRDKAAKAAQDEVNNKFVSKIPVTPEPVAIVDPFATPEKAAEAKPIPEQQAEPEHIIRRKREINAEAWGLVQKEFPYLFENGRPSDYTVSWMRKMDEYYKVHDPELAKHPGRPIYYARIKDRNLNMSPKEMEARYGHLPTGQNKEAVAAIDAYYAAELQRDDNKKILAQLEATQQQVQGNAAQIRAAQQAAEESNRRQQAAIERQAETQRKNAMFEEEDRRQEAMEMQRKIDAANPNRYKGYTSH